MHERAITCMRGLPPCLRDPIYALGIISHIERLDGLVQARGQLQVKEGLEGSLQSLEMAPPSQERVHNTARFWASEPLGQRGKLL